MTPTTPTNKATLAFLEPALASIGSVLEFQSTATDDIGQPSSEAELVTVIPETGPSILLLGGLIALSTYQRPSSSSPASPRSR